MAATTFDPNLTSELRTRWAAFKSARTSEEKTASENRIIVLFANHLAVSSPKNAAVLAAVQQLDTTDEDKKWIYEIAAQILFGAACPNLDHEQMRRAIHQKLQGYTNFEQLSKELDFRSKQFSRALKLVTGPERLLIAKLIIRASSNCDVSDFVTTLETDLKAEELTPFLKRLAPLLVENGEDVLGALAGISPYIDFIRGPNPTSLGRIQLWREMVKSITAGAAAEEQNTLINELQHLTDEDIDDFCRIVTPLCAEIKVVANRFIIFSVFSIFPRECFAQAIRLIQERYKNGHNYVSHDMIFLLTLNLIKFPLDQRFKVFQTLTWLLEPPLSHDEFAHTFTFLDKLFDKDLHKPARILEFIQTAARFRLENQVPPAVLLAAAELAILFHPDPNNLRALIGILNGVEYQSLLELRHEIKILSESQFRRAAQVCPSIPQGADRVQALINIQST